MTRSISILNICRSDIIQKNEAQSIYQNMPFSSCNLLTRIITKNSGVASFANAFAVNNRS